VDLAFTAAAAVGVLAGLVAEQRQGPAAALESAPAVLIPPAVSLHHSIDRDVRDGRQFHGPQVTYNNMVVDEVPTEAVDAVFRALADSTRRDILRRCAADEPSVSRLAQAYPMSFAAVQKHVAVLERAGLVVKVRRGREQLVHTDAAAVERARQALDELEATWRGRVERMSNLLATGGTK